MKGFLMSKSVAAPEDLDWRVSRACDNGQCIRVARKGKSVLIGNTNSPEGPVSEFTTDEWRQFLAGAKLGDFDGIA
jgi:predicted secreted Zn-dependent protease